MARLTLAGCLAAVVAAVAGACTNPTAVPRDEYYRLAVAAPAETAAAPILPGTVEVVRPIAEGLAGERPIVYSRRDTPQQVDRYDYRLWTAPPAALVQGQLVDYLRAANLAQRVVTPELRALPDWSVQGRIVHFEQVLDGRAAALAEIELALSDLKRDRVLLLKTYRTERPAADDGVAAMVAAMNGALAELFAAFAADLRAAR